MTNRIAKPRPSCPNCKHRRTFIVEEQGRYIGNGDWQRSDLFRCRVCDHQWILVHPSTTVYHEAVNASLEALFETSGYDRGRMSYESQCSYRRKQIRKYLKKKCGVYYDEDAFWAWAKDQYRVGW
jgi:hypothetical protein